MDTGCEVHVIGLEFSAAFDFISHEVLIFKLRLMGISGTLLNIIIEFLARRIQRVVVDGQCSDYRNVTSGVPQSSVFSSLQFILYTCDMCLVWKTGLLHIQTMLLLLHRSPVHL